MRPFNWNTVVTLSTLFLSSQVIAIDGDHYDGGYYVRAKVVRVEPIVRTVEVATPTEVCWNERVQQLRSGRHRQSNSPMPVLLGGVVGGVVGNQIGKRRNRDVFTIAGALIGAAVSHGIAESPRHRRARSYTTTERRCERQTEYHQEERIEGYRVTYRYHGRYFSTRSEEDPGARIRVRVQVEPTSDQGHISSSGDRIRFRESDCDREECFDS